MKNLKHPEKFVLIIGIIVLATVLLTGHFDSVRYNENVTFGPEHSLSFKDISAQEGKIDLNNANAETLQQLYQVGEARAQAIIDYRNSNCGFVSIEEITNIDGITPKIFEKNRDKLTLGNYREDKNEIRSD